MAQRFLQNVRHVLMLRCKRHRELQAISLDGPLSWVDRMAMWGHWIACGPCRDLVRQLVRIDAAAKSLDRRVDESELPGLSGAARERIRRRLTVAAGGLSTRTDPPSPPVDQ
ncbi:MAG: zf-HC2 domain-containing protein [Planctomycetota bacterium]